MAAPALCAWHTTYVFGVSLALLWDPAVVNGARPRGSLSLVPAFPARVGLLPIARLEGCLLFIDPGACMQSSVSCLGGGQLLANTLTYRFLFYFNLKTITSNAVCFPSKHSPPPSKANRLNISKLFFLRFVTNATVFVNCSSDGNEPVHIYVTSKCLD